MSIAGRNAVHGSTLTVYRQTLTEGTGGQTNIAWTPVIVNMKLELHQRTDELIRRVFGMDTNVELMAEAPVGLDLRNQDAVVVTAGLHTGETFHVTQTILSRKYLEVGLSRADDDEVIP